MTGAGPQRSPSPPAPGKLDLHRQYAAEYRASREPALVDVGPACYLALDGSGAPGGPAFQDATALLYNVAFAVKMRRKAAGQDYAVAKLEALWWDEPGAPADARWRLLIRVPEFIRESDLEQARGLLGGRARGAEAVRLERLDEGRCVQVLHVGPLAEKAGSVARMRALADAHGLRFCGPHHEVYISDPRRVPPPRLRTILRRPVCAKQRPRGPGSVDTSAQSG